jgi:hypothetical protein
MSAITEIGVTAVLLVGLAWLCCLAELRERVG